MRVIGTKSGDGAFEDRLFGEDELVVGIDRVDELGADGLADAHGEMIVDLDRERGSGREGGRLAQSSAGCQQEGQEQEGSVLHLG
jgi:hypothetical protein